jgi:glycosyltransferase involved in cell wall biosynthesis
MKVALFVHCFFPEHFYGTETYTFDVARNLLTMGHEVVVVSGTFPNERGAEIPITRYTYSDVPVYRLGQARSPTHFRESYYRPAMAAPLRAALDEIRPDIVHVTHLLNHTAVLLETAAELGIPTIATLTDFFGICHNKLLQATDESLCPGPDRDRINCIACLLKERLGNRSNSLRALTRKPWPHLAASVLRRLDLGPYVGAIGDTVARPSMLMGLYRLYRVAIAPTNFLAAAYKENGLIVPLQVQRFGVDVERLPKTSQPDHPLRLGYIGQLASHKGVDLLVDAFARLAPGAATLDIFGSGAPGCVENLRRRASAGVSYRGTFPSAEMAAVLADLDVLVIPSRWHENSPLVLLAALASGTPVVVADVAGMSEFVEPGRNGLTFARGSVDDLARALQELVSKPQAARAMSAQTRYDRSTRVMTEDLVQLYQSVLSGQSCASS